MKNCIKCTSPLNEEDRYCSICGAEQAIVRKVNNNFCAWCGAQINHGAQFCIRCGQPIRNEQTQQIFMRMVPPIIKTLSDRITLCSVIWMIIAGLQLLCGFLLLCIVSLTSDWSVDYIFALIVYFLFGGLNLKESISLLKYKKTIMSDFVGIVWTNRICFATCINYIWNAYVVYNGLASGNVLGLIFAILISSAIIIDFVSIKVFISKNKESFIQLEKSQITE